MIYALPLIFLFPALNRRLRGERAGVSRIAWFLWILDIAMVVTGDIVSAALLLIHGMAFTIPPDNALESALNGRGPTRRDSRYFQWMQDWTLAIAIKIQGFPIPNWYCFGTIYGAVRFLPQLIPIAGLCLYHHSAIPLVGILMALHGWVYRQCTRAAIFYNAENVGVVLGDLVMGLMMIEYYIVVGSL